MKLFQTIFSLLGLTVVVYTGVDIFYRVVRLQLKSMDSRKILMQRTPEVKQKKASPLRDYQIINARAIFGSEEKAPVENKIEEPEVVDLEPTSLKVALLGTVAGNDESAVAVIEETDKRKQGLYRVGDSVKTAILRKILRGKVILRVGGKDEVLTMKERSSTSRSKTAKRSRTSSRGTAKDGEITVKRSDLQRSLRNINTLLSQVRIRPHFKNGQADGLSISRIRPNSIFAKLGLKDGDIVQGIDDSAIQSPDDILSFYEKLKSGNRISIEINRRGQQKTLNYNLR